MDNKQVIEKLFNDILNRNNPEAINYIVAEDYFEQDLIKGQRQGREGVIQRLEIIFNAFPDANYKMNDVVSEGNKIAVRWTMTGTHKGEFMNIPPTDKSITLKGIDIYDIENDMIVSHWNEQDLLGLISQLKDTN